MRQTSDKLILTYDNSKYYTIDSLFMIFTNDIRINLKYLLALLNSSLLNRQYQKLNPEKGRVFAQVKIDYVNELPIVITDMNNQLKVANLVDQIMDLKKENLSGNTSLLERQINQLVYQLYNLTPEEIQIVESSIK